MSPFLADNRFVLVLHLSTFLVLSTFPRLLLVLICSPHAGEQHCALPDEACRTRAQGGSGAFSFPARLQSYRPVRASADDGKHVALRLVPKVTSWRGRLADRKEPGSPRGTRSRRCAFSLCLPFCCPVLTVFFLHSQLSRSYKEPSSRRESSGRRRRSRKAENAKKQLYFSRTVSSAMAEHPVLSILL
jgi:hypothetical protein